MLSSKTHGVALEGAHGMHAQLHGCVVGYVLVYYSTGQLIGSEFQSGNVCKPQNMNMLMKQNGVNMIGYSGVGKL